MHDSGATGAYLMPESIGSGGALFDFDNDSRLDIYLVHHAAPGSASRNQLFHQESDGRFREAIRLSPEHLEPCVLLADLNLQLGRKAEAAELIERARALSPDDRRIAILRERRGRP